MASEGYYDVKHELFISISNLKVSMLETGGVEKKIVPLAQFREQKCLCGNERKALILV